MSSAIKHFLCDVLPVIQNVFLIFLFVRGVRIYHRRKNAFAGNLVSLPAYILWLGCVVSGIFSILLTTNGLSSTQMDLGTRCLIEFFILFGTWFILDYCNQTIRYDDDVFEASNLFGARRRYDYGEITALTRKNGGVILYCGRKKIEVNEIAEASDDFLCHADKMVHRRQQHPIPIRKRGWDPMNGNLDSPWVFAIIWGSMMAASVVFFAISLQIILPANDSVPNDAQVIRTSFSSWERTKGTLTLHAEEYEKPFLLEYLSGYEVLIPAQEKLCNGETYILTVKEHKKSYGIYRISTAENQTLLRPIDRNIAYRNDQYIGGVLMACFAIAVFLSSAFGIPVGRHPECYSKTVRRWFYQDWAWSDLGKDRVRFNRNRKSTEFPSKTDLKQKSTASRHRSK